MPFEFLIIIALLLGLLWFSGSKNRRLQRERVQFQNSLEVGQVVVTGSGFVGTIAEVDEDLITLASEPGQVSFWVRQAIARPYEPEEPAEDDAEDEDDELAEDVTEDAVDPADVADDPTDSAPSQQN